LRLATASINYSSQFDIFIQDFLLYLNHVGLCTEEISDAGEAYVPTALLISNSIN